MKQCTPGNPWVLVMDLLRGASLLTPMLMVANFANTKLLEKGRSL